MSSSLIRWSSARTSDGNSGACSSGRSRVGEAWGAVIDPLRQYRRKVPYQLLLVNLLLKEDRVYDAKRHIDEARRLDPENPNILYYSAEIDVQDGRWAEAKEAYEKEKSELDKLMDPLELSQKTENPNEVQPANEEYVYGVSESVSDYIDPTTNQIVWALLVEPTKDSRNVLLQAILI